MSVLGEVKYPGMVPLSAQTSLLEGISRAGGVTENADLEGAMLVRQGQVMPVDFDKLLRAGVLAQNNLPIEPADVILVPNIAAKKVFVLGEVQRQRAMGPNSPKKWPRSLPGAPSDAARNPAKMVGAKIKEGS